jgi:hypothetical protein
MMIFQNKETEYVSLYLKIVSHCRIICNLWLLVWNVFTGRRDLKSEEQIKKEKVLFRR